jgi:hypothetical protein
MVSGCLGRGGICWLLLAMAAGCDTRERLTFPTENPDGGSPGPTTAIVRPLASDTLVTRGDVIEVQGRTTDENGVDTVYIEMDGVNYALAPLAGQGRDTVEFGFELNTDNFVGDTAVVWVFGVDPSGNKGDFDSRQFRFR